MSKIEKLMLFVVVAGVIGSTAIGCGPAHKNPPIGGTIAGDTASSPEDLIIQQREILRRQEQEKARQQRELEDLRRQEYYNDRLKQYGQ